MRPRAGALLLFASTLACADLGGLEHVIEEQEIGGVELDADRLEQRVAIRACYLGAGEPRVELELSPWIELGAGEVEATFEHAPAQVYTLTDKRPPLAPLATSLDAAAACETGVTARLSLAKPGAGHSASVAWVIVARALGEDPGVADGSIMLLVEPI